MAPSPTPAEGRAAAAGSAGPGRVVIVGGGAAGAAAARSLQRAGHDGEVLLLTAEPVAPYDRTTLSKSALIGPSDVPSPLLPDQASGASATVVRTDTTVTALHLADRRVETASGEPIAYDHLLLATGASPRALDLPGAALPFVHTLRELAPWAPLRDAVRRGDRLIVIGGGLIGLEVAAAARELGGEVTVIEVADRLMTRVLPRSVADLVAEEHLRRGVHLELAAFPTAIGADGGVALADGRELPADTVLISIGSRPRLELAETAGLRVDDGVVVDQMLRTADPHVLAAGDIVRIAAPDGSLTPRTEAWTPAVAMGQHAARTIMGDHTPFTDVPWMWSDQYDLRLQAAGAALGGLTQVTRGSLDGPGGLVVFGLEGDRVRGVVGISRGNGVGRTVRGGQMLIQHGTAVDPAALADPEVDLRRLATAR